jgi:transcriptional repressor NrdR
MKCIYCGFDDSKVIDSRATENGGIRRRRECLECAKRFTTYERVERAPIVVIKKDNTRQEFSRDKLMRGLLHACRKRPIPSKQLEKMADEIEGTLVGDNEVSVKQIGELVMERLKEVDQVAYVRFASVYKDFRDIDSFVDELELLKG